MTDLLTKVKAALDMLDDMTPFAGIAGEERLHRMSLNMAHALIAETERREKVEAENAALREMQGLPPSGTYPKGELKRRMDAKVERRERIERAAVELADAVMEQANDGRESISPRVSVTLVKFYAAMEGQSSD